TCRIGGHGGRAAADATQSSWPVHHQRGWRVLAPHHRGLVLPDPRRRRGGCTAARDPPPSQPTPHTNFTSGAEGVTHAVTHLFIAGSPYLDDNAVSGVTKSLIRELQRVDHPARARSDGVANPLGLIEFDVMRDPIPHQGELR